MSICCHDWPNCEHTPEGQSEIRAAKQRELDRAYRRHRLKSQTTKPKKKRRKRSTGNQ